MFFLLVPPSGKARQIYCNPLRAVTLLSFCSVDWFFGVWASLYVGDIRHAAAHWENWVAASGHTNLLLDRLLLHWAAGGGPLAYCEELCHQVAPFRLDLCALGIRGVRNLKQP